MLLGPYTAHRPLSPQLKSYSRQFGFSFEVEMLHLSYEFFKQLKRVQMQKSWPHLLNLLRETCSITNNPPVTLLSLGYLKLYLTNCAQVKRTKHDLLSLFYLCHM